MTAKHISSDRRRSRPVTKRSPTQKIKRNKPAMLLVILIVFMLSFSSAYVIFNAFRTEPKNPIAEINTSEGLIRVELYKDKTPKTCENFIKLAEDGFYDGLVFHRVIDGFMIQGGGYTSDGTKKESPYGTIDLEINKAVRHVDGAISMARLGDDRDSATSQFFICDGNQQDDLDDDYAAFGKVISGMEVVKEIASVGTTSKYGMNDWPINDVTINSIKIVYG